MRISSLVVTSTLLVGSVVSLGAAGCNAILGIDDHELAADASLDASLTGTASDAADVMTTPDAAVDVHLDAETSGDAEAVMADAGPPTCSIGGTTYQDGDGNPSNVCQSCQPTESLSTWSAVTDGSSCASGGICHAGACASGCEIGGLFFSANEADPSDACQTCQPSTSTTAWTIAASGASCGNGQACSNGVCGTQCVIGGTTYTSAMVNPNNSCQSCQPGNSTSAWSNVNNKTPCGSTNDVCTNGTCGCPLTNCNGVCLDTSTSTANCAACGHACSTSGASSTTCSASACNPVCVSGQFNCNGSPTPDDGCECNGTGCCPGGACQTKHSNGLGQSFFDCSPLRTYTQASAYEACAAFTGSMALCCVQSNGSVQAILNGYFYDWTWVTNPGLDETGGTGEWVKYISATSCTSVSIGNENPFMDFTWN